MKDKSITSSFRNIRNIKAVKFFKDQSWLGEAIGCDSLDQVQEVKDFYSCQCGFRCTAEYDLAISVLEHCGEAVP